MDFDQLNTFVEVAKHGSFSLAGRKVFRSQSAVSAQIRQLEQEYGEKLFGRMGKIGAADAGGRGAVRVRGALSVAAPGIAARRGRPIGDARAGF